MYRNEIIIISIDTRSERLLFISFHLRRNVKRRKAFAYVTVANVAMVGNAIILGPTQFSGQVFWFPCNPVLRTVR